MYLPAPSFLCLFWSIVAKDDGQIHPLVERARVGRAVAHGIVGVGKGVSGRAGTVRAGQAVQRIVVVMKALPFSAHLWYSILG